MGYPSCMKLYSYWRSSAAYRVRIALNLKGVDYQYCAVNLLNNEHQSAAYLSLNPAGLVPTLILPDGRQLNQSLAIIQWLESEYPTPPLLSADHYERARVLAMAYTVACEIHPLNNMRILKYLRAEYGADEGSTTQWMHHWLQRGFASLEQDVTATPFCAGAQLSLADLVLVPMAYNALRFNYPLQQQHPKLFAIWQTCNTLQAFIDALPENQADAIL